MVAHRLGKGRLQETSWFPQENTVRTLRTETCRGDRAADDSGSEK